MKTNIFYFFTILFLFACNNQENPNDELFDKLYGSKLVCPQNLENVNDTLENIDVFFNKPVKIVTESSFKSAT